MKHFVAFALALGIGPTLASGALTVRGELSFDSGGFAQVAECGSGRVFTLGVMASNPYFHLTQRYEEAADGGRFAVLIEVTGSLASSRSSNGGRLVLDSPDISTLVRGSCADSTPNTSLERTREE